MESWRLVWRKGLAPLLSAAGLAALKYGLETDDKRLLQGATTTPPPLQCVQDWPTEAGDAIVYAHWQGDKGGDLTVQESEEWFAKCCFDCDEKLGEPAGCRWFLNWHDEAPREEMVADLLEEVIAEIYHRAGCPYEAMSVILKAPNAPAWAMADMLDDAGFDQAAQAMRLLNLVVEVKT